MNRNHQKQQPLFIQVVARSVVCVMIVSSGSNMINNNHNDNNNLAITAAIWFLNIAVGIPIDDAIPEMVLLLLLLR